MKIEPNRAPSLASRLFVLSAVLLILFFGFLRFYKLSARPLHHDEGVNGNFLKILVNENNYKYDPTNYHGPSLYYFQLIPTWFNSFLIEGPQKFSFKSYSGMTPASVRSLTAAAGLLIVVLMFAAIPRIGRAGAFAAFLLAGFSCNLLFISRYFIHEIFVVLFTFGIYLSLVWYQDRKKPLYLALAALSATLLFCTKETSVIIIGVLSLAVICTEFTHWGLQENHQRQAPFPFLKNGGPSVSRTFILLTIVACLATWALFFSSFGRNWRGLADSFLTYTYWAKQGMESGHTKPFPYYVNSLLVKYELPMFMLFFVGVVTSFFKNEKSGLFLTYWSLGITAAYSLIPYKTPWIIPNMILPMTLTAGYGVQRFIDAVVENEAIKQKKGVLSAAGAAVGVVFFIQTPQTFIINYKEYDADRYEMIYGHTVRDVYRLLNNIESYAQKTVEREKIRINIVAGQYWPLPFYFLKYPHAAFWGRIEGVPQLDAPLILAEGNQRGELDAKLKDFYDVESYSLRPGLPLFLYTRKNDQTAASSKKFSVFTPVTVGAGKLSPGLLLRAYTGTDFKGLPLRTVKGDTAFDFWWDKEEQKLFRSPFSLEWTGFITIPKDGDYQFSLESDDGSWLYINDVLVIDNGGQHASTKLSQGVSMKKGLHRLRIKYFDLSGGAVLRFSWLPPGLYEQIVPRNVLSYEP